MSILSTRCGAAAKPVDLTLGDADGLRVEAAVIDAARVTSGFKVL